MKHSIQKLKGLKPFLISFILFNLLANSSIAQQNISGSSGDLDVEPKISSSGNIVWNSIGVNSDSHVILKYYNGNSIREIDSSPETFKNIQIYDDKILYYKKSSISTADYFYFNGSTANLLQANVDDPNGFLFDKGRVLYTAQNKSQLKLFDGTSQHDIHLDSQYVDTTQKQLLTWQNNSFTFKNKTGELWLVNLMNDSTGSAERLDITRQVTSVYQNDQQVLWIENRNGSSLVYEYKEGNTVVVPFTASDTSNIAFPVSSNEAIAYRSRSGGIDKVIYVSDGVANVVYEGSQIGVLEFAGDILRWSSAEDGSSFSFYNGVVVNRLDEPGGSNNYFESSSRFIVWAESADSIDFIRYLNTQTLERGELQRNETVYNLNISGTKITWHEGTDSYDVYYYDLENSEKRKYVIGNKKLEKCNQSATFYIPFITSDTSNTGLTGLDFTIYYDTSKIAATGNAIVGKWGAYGLNVNPAGYMHVTLYLNGAGEGIYISGEDTLINLEFVLKDESINGFNTEISSSGIEESLLTSTQNKNAAVPGNVYRENNGKGILVYRGIDDRPLKYDINNPDRFLPTKIYRTNYLCQRYPSDFNLADTLGSFYTGSVKGDSRVSFERDVPGDFSIPAMNCSDVMNVINSSDALQALAISNYSNPYPSIYELLSADVNLDGRVTAGDVSLISSRTINSNNCEFPQKNYMWNGNKYVPSPDYIKSKDWLFVNQDFLNLITKADRNSVPSVPECLRDIALLEAYRSCYWEFNAILLGDVDGSWESKDGKNLRKGNGNEISLLLSELKQNANDNFIVPIKAISEDEIYGLDFSFVYNDNNLSIVNVFPGVGNDSIQVKYNNVENKKLMVTSFKSSENLNQEYVIHLELALKEVTDIYAEIKSFKGYVNGNEATLVNEAITSVSSGKVFSQLLISPNPTAGKLIIHADISPSSKIEISDMTGKVHNEYNVKFGNDFTELYVEKFNTGTYLLKITQGDKVSFSKIIKW